MKILNDLALKIDSDLYSNAIPIPHIVIDDFFKLEIASEISKSFPDYESDQWHVYANSIENKKTINNWNHFDSLQYQVFTELNSPLFVDLLAKLTGSTLYSDSGLHGGGLHIHAGNGNLNPHLDYSLHPKTGLQRKLNVIVYLEEGFKAEYGGHLGLWKDGGNGQPGKLVTEVFPKFNRAVIFDTTKMSWHGLSRSLNLEEGKYRKSFAVYYLQQPEENVDPRTRALFAPREDQKDDTGVLDLIKVRSDEKSHAEAYIK
jgi:Rps23 Pro-64 3,4-dihydroxylase Tpa1-like proline 4-hydroxylase